MRIIDAHIHLCNMRKPYTKEDLLHDLGEADADGAVIFAQPADMYREVDDAGERAKANQYCLDSAEGLEGWYPYYFVWNDYVIPDNFGEYVGIKWHRHHDEPRYDYAVSACERFIQAIRERNIPTTLEEEFDNTVALVERLMPAPVIIPHCGKLNGGHLKMDAFFANPRVYFDTSTANPEALAHILGGVGPERVIFGSDVSGTSQPYFNFTKVELEKVLQLGLSDTELEMVLAQNVEGLIAEGH